MRWAMIAAWAIPISCQKSTRFITEFRAHPRVNDAIDEAIGEEDDGRDGAKRIHCHVRCLIPCREAGHWVEFVRQDEFKYANAEIWQNCKGKRRHH